MFVDAASAVFLRSLRLAIGEDSNYEGAIERAKKSGLKNPWWLGKVQPVSFGASGAHRVMLGHAKMMMDKGLVAIHPKFTKLITALRTAYETDGILDKEKTAHDDVFDAFRMALRFFELACGPSQYLGR